MRYYALAAEFEEMVRAFRLGNAEPLRDVARKLRARLTTQEADLLERGQSVDEASYHLGALDAASELLLVTAARAERTSAVRNLQQRNVDQKVLRVLGLWFEQSRSTEGLATVDDRSQKALAALAGVDAGMLSKTILPRLEDGGFVRPHVRGRIRRIEISDSGIAALDQVNPSWRTVESAPNEIQIPGSQNALHIGTGYHVPGRPEGGDRHVQMMTLIKTQIVKKVVSKPPVIIRLGYKDFYSAKPIVETAPDEHSALVGRIKLNRVLMRDVEFDEAAEKVRLVQKTENDLRELKRSARDHHFRAQDDRASIDSLSQGR